MKIITKGIYWESDADSGSLGEKTVSVCKQQGYLRITTPGDTRLSIYTFGGNLLLVRDISAGHTTVSAPKGPCIVLVGEKAFKIGK